MARRKTTESKRPIEAYQHADKQRLNNPPVGLVTPETDPETGKQAYAYDPHLDPQLQWAGKAEHTSFEVPTVSLHVHERIDPRSIVEAVRRRNGAGPQAGAPVQPALFSLPDENPPIREAIEFYRHRHNWSNRLIAGDSLLVMNSLLQKEGLAGKVQMIYIDPPYGIKYGSNFQPFVNRRDVKDGKDEDLTAEPEQIRAFRDTWELGIHSYLTYLRDRLLLARDLLHESGSVFVQIGDENVHHVRELMDEVFGSEHFCALLSFAKTSGLTRTIIPSACDYILWYGKDFTVIKYRQLYKEKILGEESSLEYFNIELPDGTCRRATEAELRDNSVLPNGSRVFAYDSIVSGGSERPERQRIRLEHDGKTYTLDCGPNRNWKSGYEGTIRLWEAGRLARREGLRIYKRYFSDFPYAPLKSVWMDTRGETEMTYVIQTTTRAIQRCLLMTTDPGDLVLDPTCGSGTTAYVAE